jgi:hypothetical protein
MKMGTGPRPTLQDKVKVHYIGTLIDGTNFDSSYKRNQPATFQVSGVIPGFAEALLLMPVGSKFKIFLPSSLAYGAQGAGNFIKPNSTLIFEVELLEIIGVPSNNSSFSNGLVAYYPFNGNANDESGNGNNGLVNGATFVADRFGNPRAACLFNGHSDYIEIPNSSSFYLPNQITISLWLKLQSDAPYYYPYHIIEKQDAWGIGQRGNDIHGSNGPWEGVWSLNLEFNRFLHYVLSYDGNTIKVYINGILNGSKAQSGLINTNSNNIFIGKYSLSGNYYFDGIIDDIRVYNRSLNDNEISSLYHEGGWGN